MKNHHSCKAILFLCLDWRLHPSAELYFSKKYKNFDLCVNAGSIKSLNNRENQRFLLEQIKISQKLHHSSVIILTTHKDCGAYGGSNNFRNEKEELDFQIKELKKCEEIIHQELPNIRTEKYFIDLKIKKGQWVPTFKKIK